MEKVAIGSFNHPVMTNPNPAQKVLGDFTEDQVEALRQYLSQEGKDQLTQWQNAENPQYKAFLSGDLLPKLQVAFQEAKRQMQIQTETSALVRGYRAGSLDLLALTPREFRLLSNALPPEEREDLQSEKLMQLLEDTNRKITTLLLYNSRANKILGIFPLRGMDEIDKAALAANPDPLSVPPNGRLCAILWNILRG
jgi:hypothetical protein